MNNETKMYCSKDELCPRRDGHYGACFVPVRARDALNASRRLRHEQHNELSAQLLTAQQVLADLVDGISLGFPMDSRGYSEGVVRLKGWNAARELLDQQKEVAG